MVVVMGKLFCNIQYRHWPPRFAIELVESEGCNGDKWKALCIACLKTHLTIWIDSGVDSTHE